jgi:hypothetical protein
MTLDQLEVLDSQGLMPAMAELILAGKEHTASAAQAPVHHVPELERKKFEWQQYCYQVERQKEGAARGEVGAISA